ncbi:hypothetical protein Taro_048827 [Colocasia esculenta]|uniref:Uncharacterized protein n=1 Tax=Colocasia esculenta TaxID=4460 RepID=A0A843X977_COLES|nr:hypothetical protein [Colocasia esculenta]
MGSGRVGEEYSGMETPPRLCYHALPSSQRAGDQPLGTATPPLQAPGSVPFQWEVAPGKPRGAVVDEPQIWPKPVSARRLEPPPRMALLSSTPSATWQVAKVADDEQVASKTVLGGPYYVLLRPPPSLFDGPSVMSRSNSLSSASFGRFAVRDEGIRRKERTPSAWFWRRSAVRRDGVSSMRKKVDAAAVAHDGEAALSGADARGRGYCGHDLETAAAANVRITRFRRNGSLPNLSAAGNHLWSLPHGMGNGSWSSPIPFCRYLWGPEAGRDGAVEDYQEICEQEVIQPTDTGLLAGSLHG